MHFSGNNVSPSFSPATENRHVRFSAAGENETVTQCYTRWNFQGIGKEPQTFGVYNIHKIVMKIDRGGGLRDSLDLLEHCMWLDKQTDARDLHHSNGVQQT